LQVNTALGPIPSGAVVLQGDQLEDTLRRLLDERRPTVDWRAEWLKPAGISCLLVVVGIAVGGILGWHDLRGDVDIIQESKAKIEADRREYRAGIDERLKAADKRVDDVKDAVFDRMDRGFDVARERDGKRAKEISDLAGDTKAIRQAVESLVARQDRLEARQDRGPFGEGQSWPSLPEDPFSLRAKTDCLPPLSPIVRRMALADGER
jgi:hypothetical protein